MIGNGPFAITEWVHGDHITLGQNAQYSAHANWPKPTLTRATLVMSTSPEADYAAYMKNNRDWTLVPDAHVNPVLNDPNLAGQSRQYNELTTFWVHVNTARAPLSNVTLRRALATAVDRKAFVRDIAGGIGLPMTSIIPPGMPGFQEGLGQELGFDPDDSSEAPGAGRLCQWSGSARSRLQLPRDHRQSAARRVPAGAVEAESRHRHPLSPMDPAAYQQALAAKNYDLAFGGWAADYPDPQDWFNAVFGCKGSYNSSNYCNPGFDQVVARADTATTLSERVLLYNQAQARLIGDTPVLPCFHPVTWCSSSRGCSRRMAARCRSPRWTTIPAASSSTGSRSCLTSGH